MTCVFIYPGGYQILTLAEGPAAAAAACPGGGAEPSPAAPETEALIGSADTACNTGLEQ